MAATALEASDIDLAPVFWRPSADASTRHRAFLDHLLTEAGAHGFRTDAAVLIAAPRVQGWLVDDMHVPGPDWSGADGGALWNALDGVAHGAPVRFVCPVPEKSRADFAQAAGLTVAETWWLRELPDGPGGGEAGVEVDLSGTAAVTVAAPPVYDPGGPVLFIPALADATTGLSAAVSSAPDLGCRAIVVSQVAGDVAVAQTLSKARFRRHLRLLHRHHQPDLGHRPRRRMSAQTTTATTTTRTTSSSKPMSNMSRPYAGQRRRARKATGRMTKGTRRPDVRSRWLAR